MNSFVNQNQYPTNGMNFNPYQTQWNMPQQNRLSSGKRN